MAIEGDAVQRLRLAQRNPKHLNTYASNTMDNDDDDGDDNEDRRQWLRFFFPAAALDMGDASNKAIPRWPWFVFLARAIGCLICSSLSHLFACHSKCWNVFFWRLDYAGISLMIGCSFFVPIYHAFSYNPYSRFLYLTSCKFCRQ
ncbi:Heptahelical transmembrane protein 2 [Camellia lanceoleosa]|uniref:Heptahelical transmembrane protein 2 n=1 Tax=Camellia lanceoleosa TaxID=1840588 RepID=A0ACC0GG93_9ERIC|nr:Heptahelical transmembrane protein 2 [Camellia lanceoleosa]